MALVAGLVAVLIRGGVLSVASLIGFITLFGVAVRHGLLLVDNFNRCHQSGEPPLELIRNGSLERLNAILMTALTSSLGMLPSAPCHRRAQVLISSTMFTLEVIPAVYSRYGRWLLPQALNIQ